MDKEFFSASKHDCKDVAFFMASYNQEKGVNWDELVEINLSYDDTKILVLKNNGSISVVATFIDEGITNGFKTYCMYSFTTSEEVTDITDITDYYRLSSGLLMHDDSINYRFIYNEPFFDKKAKKRKKLYYLYLEKIGFEVYLAERGFFKFNYPFLYKKFILTARKINA